MARRGYGVPVLEWSEPREGSSFAFINDTTTALMVVFNPSPADNHHPEFPMWSPAADMTSRYGAIAVAQWKAEEIARDHAQKIVDALKRKRAKP